MHLSHDGTQQPLGKSSIGEKKNHDKTIQFGSQTVANMFKFPLCCIQRHGLSFQITSVKTLTVINPKLTGQC